MHERIFPRPGQTGLVVIDMQEGLFKVIPEESAQRLVKAHHVLLQWADISEVPVYYTEHYPRGLGPTIAPLRESLSSYPQVVKTEFSACHNPDFRETVMKSLPEDVLLTGIETHICILLTAMDLIRYGFRVFVPIDAVASRDPDNWHNGLALLEKVGALATNTESIVFHQLAKAEGEAFKRMIHVLK